MNEKFYSNAVDIKTKQIDEVTETVTLFEGEKSDNLGSKTQTFYTVTMPDFTIIVRFFKMIISSILFS